MEHSQDKIAFLILLGGQSSRFNYNDKANLKINNKTFIQKINNELKNMDVYYSLANNTKEELNKLKSIKYKKEQLVFDKYKNIGPIGALKSFFDLHNYENVFLISCDIPNITNELITYVVGKFYLSLENKSLIISSDKIQPCFSIYNKSTNKILTIQIENKNYKMMDLINKINKVEVNITNPYFQNQLKNINCNEDYFKFKKPFVFCISGYKNSGKTTMICNLAKLFIKDNYKVAVLKHDGHDFVINHDNTDTKKFEEANIKDITIYSNEKNLNINYNKFNINKYIKLKKEANYDFVIIEGLKNSDLPKIELVLNEKQKYFEFENVFLKISNHLKEADYKYEQTNEIYKKILKESYAR